MSKEQTLVLLKHDAIQRNLVGKIITRFEETGLKLAGMKMIWADDEIALNHYPLDEEWAKKVHDKTKIVYDEKGKSWPYKNYIEMGKTIQSWLVTFLKEGPIIALVLEGPHAIEVVRKIVGNTEPRQAAPGTIRGDYAMIESYTLADDNKRVLRNLIHASDTIENAKREISLWFNNSELSEYSKELDKHF
ncbi:MAG: nucleoside-diphosphate kinase [Nanoarchaeota archaeon]|nr:nucleoside-diphosphate kinase [Nanoarchaeota archaeon]